jgi:hypothetical protein
MALLDEVLEAWGETFGLGSFAERAAAAGYADTLKIGYSRNC